MQKVKTVILGATVFGAAAAMEKPGSTIILEKSMLIGSEFISSMNIKSCNIECQTESARNFEEDMKRCGLLNKKGEIHVFPVSGILSSYIRKTGASTLLMTDIVSIKSQPSGFLITIYNSDGFSELFAERIIDTTSEGILHRNSETVPYQKCICAMLLNCDDSNIEGYDDGKAVILKGKLDGEYVLKVKLDKNADWPTAREILYNYWQKHVKTVFKGWKIASVASSFAYDFGETIEKTVKAEESVKMQETAIAEGIVKAGVTALELLLWFFWWEV